MSLRGKTILITGGSRGIGKAIALRAARDGANLVLAAKTAEPHPKLPGTIYSAAEEVEQAGGRALPLQLDIRDEVAVQAAVKQAAEYFGGIDVLINNASAISLTGTLQTTSKKFDLMFGVNVRGTYMCSQACLPYLQQASNPHILTLSPPLNLHPKWFRDHAAYTIAKYGMSMCVLGMAEEFRAAGVAINALWPKTLIATAALQAIDGTNPAGGRNPGIMADAAYAILCKDSRSITGKFLIDEDVLRAEGVTDFAKYSMVQGAKLDGDLFLDAD